ncbi:MAG: hypothetical protein K5641_02190 [Lachnospiraceae bacterium]|nr:hypothetical protein [Lachnospiraceae bacterium]
MADVEKIFKNADFSKGSDHKERLKGMLKSLENGAGEMPLSDDELELAAAGKMIFENNDQNAPKSVRV